METWSKLRILLLAVTLGCVVVVFLNVLQKQSFKKPKLEEIRSEVYIDQLQPTEITSQPILDF
ncbi:hypothetical protein H6G80_27660 [Nostoc sp. FACHB-87]|uniref:hypothetical protein n=1 Tax=Nostocales TaxID=1161 RepID=UPI0016866516|nr:MULTISPECIES: hypothetical protein [Nostocales]MBD2457831.1 hypothetical protein [Nostoc sp. FACHB-87]MBD2479057.1 hypothetical protein [Anabaena sp. FACHB-83]MBD2487909.1 hypothetical protein [Aulosira sp. FACHB-615]